MVDLKAVKAELKAEQAVKAELKAEPEDAEPPRKSLRRSVFYEEDVSDAHNPCAEPEDGEPPRKSSRGLVRK